MELNQWKTVLIPYQYAVEELKVKFKNIRKELIDNGEYSPIEFVTGRVKKISSIIDKAKRLDIDLSEVDDKIEDILITLGKQYHIIRPSTHLEGVFIYLVMDRARANLAMARRKTQDAEKEMMF